MATHSSILTREIPWTEALGELQSTASQSQTRPSHSVAGSPRRPMVTMLAGHTVHTSCPHAPTRYVQVLTTGRGACGTPWSPGPALLLLTSPSLLNGDGIYQSEKTHPIE